VTRAVLDDHLLRDLLADDLSEDLAGLLAEHEPATTNLYLFRLCRSVVSAPGGALTGSWDAEGRRALGAQLLVLPGEIEVVPIRVLAFRMAEIAGAHRVSTLGAEAVAAAENLRAPLCVWEGDDGPSIRAAVVALDGDYRTVAR
jgi:predicted transcriptional regulator with HTH domain